MKQIYLTMPDGTKTTALEIGAKIGKTREAVLRRWRLTKDINLVLDNEYWIKRTKRSSGVKLPYLGAMLTIPELANELEVSVTTIRLWKRGGVASGDEIAERMKNGECPPRYGQPGEDGTGDWSEVDRAPRVKVKPIPELTEFDRLYLGV